MKYRDQQRIPLTALLAALLLGAGLVACDNQVNVSGPTFPEFDPQIAPVWTLSVSGTLAADGASCVRAAILLDGQEIPGARSRCDQAGGCAELDLSGSVTVLEGPHTITFQVLRQNAEQDTYLAYGTVSANRADLDLGFDDVLVNLEHRRASLEQGDGITYEFNLQDFD